MIKEIKQKVVNIGRWVKKKIKEILIALGIIGVAYAYLVGNGAVPPPAIVVDGVTIEFSYTDSTSGESLIIWTDREVYGGPGGNEVYLAIQNESGKKQKIDLGLFFGRNEVYWEKVAELERDVPRTIIVDDYKIVEYDCGYWAETATSTPSVWFDQTCERQEKTGSHEETIYENEWTPLFLTDFSKDKYEKDIKEKEIEVKDKKEYEAKEKLTYNIEAGEVSYLKAEVRYPLGTNEEFFIEAIGDQGGYGHLDPWLTGYSYRKKITIASSTAAGTDYQVPFTIGASTGGDFHLENHSTDFPNDVRFTDDDEETELDYWIEATTTATSTVWVEVTDDLGSDVDVYVYYGKSGASTTSSGDDTFLFFDDFEDDSIDGAKWTETDLDAGESFYESGGKIGVTDSDTLATFFNDRGLASSWSVATNTFEVLLETASWDDGESNQPQARWGLYIGESSTVRIMVNFYDAWTGGTGGKAWNIDGDADDTDWNDLGHTGSVDLRIRKDEDDLVDCRWDGASLISATSTTAIDRLMILYAGHKNANYDTTEAELIRVRKYVATEPAFSSAGSEESPPSVGRRFLEFK